MPKQTRKPLESNSILGFAKKEKRGNKTREERERNVPSGEVQMKEKVFVCERGPSLNTKGSA